MNFKYNLNLPKIQLAYKNISTISIEASQEQLFELVLSGNRINGYDFVKYLPNLQLLYLDSCGIKDVKFLQSLSQLQKLSFLSLRRNEIESVASFPVIVSLHTLDLSQNMIKNFSELNFSYLQSLFFGLNPVSESCEIPLYLKILKSQEQDLRICALNNKNQVQIENFILGFSVYNGAFHISGHPSNSKIIVPNLDIKVTVHQIIRSFEISQILSNNFDVKVVVSEKIAFNCSKFVNKQEQINSINQQQEFVDFYKMKIQQMQSDTGNYFAVSIVYDKYVIVVFVDIVKQIIVNMNQVAQAKQKLGQIHEFEQNFPKNDVQRQLPQQDSENIITTFGNYQFCGKYLVGNKIKIPESNDIVSSTIYQTVLSYEQLLYNIGQTFQLQDSFKLNQQLFSAISKFNNSTEQVQIKATQSFVNLDLGEQEDQHIQLCVQLSEIGSDKKELELKKWHLGKFIIVKLQFSDSQQVIFGQLPVERIPAIDHVQLTQVSAVDFEVSVSQNQKPVSYKYILFEILSNGEKVGETAEGCFNISNFAFNVEKLKVDVLVMDRFGNVVQRVRSNELLFKKEIEVQVNRVEAQETFVFPTKVPPPAVLPVQALAPQVSPSPDSAFEWKLEQRANLEPEDGKFCFDEGQFGTTNVEIQTEKQEIVDQFAQTDEILRIDWITPLKNGVKGALKTHKEALQQIRTDLKVFKQNQTFAFNQVQQNLQSAIGSLVEIFGSVQRELESMKIQIEEEAKSEKAASEAKVEEQKDEEKSFQKQANEVTQQDEKKAEMLPPANNDTKATEAQVQQ